MPFDSSGGSKQRAELSEGVKAAKLREQQDLWQISPINIVKMPVSSAEPSRAPPNRLSQVERLAAATDSLTMPSYAPPKRPSHVEGAAATDTFVAFLAQTFNLEQRTLQCPLERPATPLFSDPIANREAKYLGLSNSPSRWCGGNDGWILWTKYPRVIDWKTRSPTAIKGVTMQRLPVKISTLKPSEQCIAYRHLIKTATPAQIVEYYKLFRDRLDEARCSVAERRVRHWEDHGLIQQVFLSSLCREIGISVATQGARLSDAEQRLAKSSRKLARSRAFARGLEQLIEACEALLRAEKEEGEEAFTAVDWRAFTSRKRWRDGERGWTGLREDDVHSDVVGVCGREVGLKTKVRGEGAAEKAGLRARFARCFPRAVDRRNGAGDGNGGASDFKEVTVQK